MVGREPPYPPGSRWQGPRQSLSGNGGEAFWNGPAAAPQSGPLALDLSQTQPPGLYNVTPINYLHDLQITHDLFQAQTLSEHTFSAGPYNVLQQGFIGTQPNVRELPYYSDRLDRSSQLVASAHLQYGGEGLNLMAPGSSSQGGKSRNCSGPTETGGRIIRPNMAEPSDKWSHSWASTSESRSTHPSSGSNQQPWASKAGREATPTLRDLVEHGILQPGPGVLSYKHSGNDFIATLTAEGTILFHGRVFQSPTSFATSCRGRTVSGWREVLYRGTRLDNFRNDFCKKYDVPHVVGSHDLEDKLRRMTLQELINAGYLVPEKDCVMLHHKGRFFTGTLTADGFIMYNGKSFGTPTGFAAHCTDSSPSRCRGWHRVTYNGHPLDHYRRLLCNQLFSQREAGSEAESVQARMMEQIEARRARPAAQTSASDKLASSSTSRTGSPGAGGVAQSVASEVSAGQVSQAEQVSAPVLPPFDSLGQTSNLHGFLLDFFSKFCEFFQIDGDDRAKTARFVGILTSIEDAAAQQKHYNLLRYAYGNADGASLLKHISDAINDMHREQPPASGHAGAPSQA